VNGNASKTHEARMGAEELKVGGWSGKRVIYNKVIPEDTFNTGKTKKYTIDWGVMH
jgi:hypothetical protein